MRRGHRAREQLERVAGLDDGVGVLGLARGPDAHGAVDQVELAGETDLLFSFFEMRKGSREKEGEK